VKKIKIDDCICHSRIKKHFEIKNKILSEIDNDVNKSLNISDEYHIDNISKLDWDVCSNFNRPWVKIFLPCLYEDIKEVICSMAYNKIMIKSAWYQQYLEGDTHGWHIHGQHYTGVYYLEFSEECSKTEICSPFSLETKQIDAVEGDFIIFPAHYIHRGLPNKKSRKTIISFNFDIVANSKNNLPALNINLLNTKNA
tara:strand:+ start:197 stop:787 length:591 start_codon:yes stop_codon:yes gene_type:complete